MRIFMAMGLVACLLGLWGCGGARLKEPAAETAVAATPAAETTATVAAPVGVTATPLPAIEGTAAAVPALSHGTVTLRWRTSSEVDVAGYNVRRAQSPDGPFQPANTGLIPATGGLGVAAQYVFTDRGLQSGQTYHYYLEEVLADGEQRALSEVKPYVAMPGE